MLNSFTKNLLQKKGENGKTKEDTKNPNVLKGNKTQQRG
jgi:hypothetical protein